MYSREESFWTGRLSKLQQQQQADSGPASPTSPAVHIPAARGGDPLAVIPALLQPAACEAALAQTAQIEALKLQVATLRRTNTQLSKELASLQAERARAARAAALERLTQLQLKGSSPAASGAASHPPAIAHAAGVMLQLELGVEPQPSSESVPLQYLERLHALYQAHLDELQEAHATALEQQQQEREAALRRQAEQYEREAALLADAAEDPAREAEIALLRDDCAYLKRKIGELSNEYRQRVQVAAAEARLAALQQAAAERKQLEAALAVQQRRAAEQRASGAAAVAAAEEAAEDAAGLERAHHAAELQRLREQHCSELAAVQAQSAAALAEREREYAAMLEELRVLHLAMSRASTRQEERVDACWQQGALPMPLQQAAYQQQGQQQQQQQQGQRGSRTPTAAGQLMEPHSDEEDGRWWERPRAMPPLPLPRQHA